MLEALWNKRIPPSISVQVLQELYVNVIKGGLSDKEAKGVIEDYLNWDVIDNDLSLLLEGIKEKSRWKISFWDGLIIAAARQAKASIIWSEDFSSSQNYEGIIILNPLREIS